MTNMRQIKTLSQNVQALTEWSAALGNHNLPTCYPPARDRDSTL